MLDERRDHRRIPHLVAVDLTSHNNFWTGFTRDISTGGIFVATADLLPPGSTLEFTLALGAARVRASGEVRWVRDPADVDDSEGVEPGMGIAFLDLDDADRALVNRFIDELRDALFYEDPDED